MPISFHTIGGGVRERTATATEPYACGTRQFAWRGSQSAIERSTADLDEQTRRKIICETTASLYHFAGDAAS